MRLRALVIAGCLALLMGCGSSDDGAGSGAPGAGEDGAGTHADTATPAPDGQADTVAAADGADGPTCSNNQTRCGGTDTIEVCRDGAWEFLNLCTDPLQCIGGTCQSSGRCEPGSVLGCTDATTVKRCTAEGVGAEGEPCPEGEFCLNGACGEQQCVPLSSECRDENTLHYCNNDGTGWIDPTPCGQNSLCVGSQCISGCEADYKFGSYVGCEYWTVDLDQFDDPFTDPDKVPHAVVISNPGDRTAHLLFRSFSSTPVTVATPEVPPGQAVAFEMPRHDVDESGVFDRSIQIRSDLPVLAAQFNPLNNEGVASNDGTLLLPRAVLGREYFTMSWPSSPVQRGYITILAVRPGRTEIGVQLSANVEATMDPANTAAVSPVPSFVQGQTAPFLLEQGQVLQLTADGSISAAFSGRNDLTGSRVFSDKPVVVFGGHEEAVIDRGREDDDCCCADHLEEQMIPTFALSGEVVCGKSASRGDDPDLWRILAVDDLVLSTDPPQVDLDGGAVTGRAMTRGQWLEIRTEDSFVAASDGGRLLVGQYLVSQGCTDRFLGDPAMINGVPTAQWRNDYPILVPQRYSENWLTIARSVGQGVLIDGTPVDDALFAPIGSSTYEIAHVPIDEGPHRIQGAAPFGLTQVGYSAVVSYGLVPGMNITDLAP